MYNNTPKDVIITNTKTKGPLFDSGLINDTIATCLTILSIINQFEGRLSLNRIRTNALEHHFGLLRIKSKYNDDFDTLFSSESKTQILSDIEHEVLGTITNLRRPSYGVDVDLNCEIYGNNYGMNKYLALSIYMEIIFQFIYLMKKSQILRLNIIQHFFGIFLLKYS